MSVSAAPSADKSQQSLPEQAWRSEIQQLPGELPAPMQLELEGEDQWFRVVSTFFCSGGEIQLSFCWISRLFVLPVGVPFNSHAHISSELLRCGVDLQWPWDGTVPEQLVFCCLLFQVIFLDFFNLTFSCAQSRKYAACAPSFEMYTISY